MVSASPLSHQARNVNDNTPSENERMRAGQIVSKYSVMYIVDTIKPKPIVDPMTSATRRVFLANQGQMN